MYKIVDHHFEIVKKNHNNLSSIQKDEEKDLMEIFQIQQSLHTLPSSINTLQKISNTPTLGLGITLETPNFSF